MLHDTFEAHKPPKISLSAGPTVTHTDGCLAALIFVPRACRPSLHCCHQHGVHEARPKERLSKAPRLALEDNVTHSREIRIVILSWCVVQMTQHLRDVSPVLHEHHVRMAHTQDFHRRQEICLSILSFDGQTQAQGRGDDHIALEEVAEELDCHPFPGTFALAGAGSQGDAHAKIIVAIPVEELKPVHWAHRPAFPLRFGLRTLSSFLFFPFSLLLFLLFLLLFLGPKLFLKTLQSAYGSLGPQKKEHRFDCTQCHASYG